MPEKTYHIKPIPLCRGMRKKGGFTYRMNYGDSVDSAHYVWYIEGAKPNILVDAGVTTEMMQKKEHPTEGHIQSLEEGLAGVGLKPDDIDIVIVTHLHWDHVALASRYKKAKFIVQKDELDFARHPHPLAASAFDMNLVKGVNFEIISGDKEIIPGVSTMMSPGHSPGGQSVAVNTPGGLAIITGFCCIQENFFPPPSAVAKGLEVIPPGSALNALQAYDSALRIKKAAKIILALHDAGYIETKRIPE